MTPQHFYKMAIQKCYSQDGVAGGVLRSFTRDYVCRAFAFGQCEGLLWLPHDGRGSFVRLSFGGDQLSVMRYGNGKRSYSHAWIGIPVSPDEITMAKEPTPEILTKLRLYL
jgi:hypothetical protein